MDRDGNWIGKGERAKRAASWIERMKAYDKETESSVNASVIGIPEILHIPVRSYDYMETKIFNLGVVDSIFSENCTGKIAVLNFASYKNPGGMFLSGSNAQEENLCHSSNLYNVLAKMKGQYYDKNISTLNKSLYTSSMIYSPNIVFIKEAEEAKLPLVGRGENKRIADVITCAAPNKAAAQKYCNVTDAKVKEVMAERIDRILSSAVTNCVETLILGAYGCGVFGNDPVEVAEIFKKALFGKYYKCFKTVMFAIPAGKNDNNKAFQKVFFERK